MHQEIKDSLPGDNRSSERFLYTINRTFNLPSLINRQPMMRSSGIQIGTSDLGHIPNLDGQFSVGSEWVWTSAVGSFTGPFQYGDGINLTIVKSGGAQMTGNKVRFNAHNVSTIFDPNADGVYPKHLVMNFYIKY